jgi:hypothetical protein
MKKHIIPPMPMNIGRKITTVNSHMSSRKNAKAPHMSSRKNTKATPMSSRKNAAAPHMSSRKNIL